MTLGRAALEIPQPHSPFLQLEPVVGVHVSRLIGPLPPSRPAAPNYKIDTSRPWTATAQITNTSTAMMSSAHTGE